MKRVLVLMMVALVMFAAYEVYAAGTARTYPTKYGAVASKTVTKQIGGVWDSTLAIADTTIPGLVSDSMYIVYTVTGNVNLAPGGKLYLAWTTNSIATAIDTLAQTALKTAPDTQMVKCPKWAKGPMDIPFCVRAVRTVSADSTGTAGANRYHYLSLAVGGSSGIERALITSLQAVIHQERR